MLGIWQKNSISKSWKKKDKRYKRERERERPAARYGRGTCGRFHPQELGVVRGWGTRNIAQVGFALVCSPLTQILYPSLWSPRERERERERQRNYSAALKREDKHIERRVLVRVIRACAMVSWSFVRREKMSHRLLSYLCWFVSMLLYNRKFTFLVEWI